MLGAVFVRLRVFTGRVFRQFGDVGGLVGVVIALEDWEIIDKVIGTNLLVHFGEFIVNPGHGFVMVVGVG